MLEFYIMKTVWDSPEICFSHRESCSWRDFSWFLALFEGVLKKTWQWCIMHLCLMCKVCGVATEKGSIAEASMERQLIQIPRHKHTGHSRDSGVQMLTERLQRQSLEYKHEERYRDFRCLGYGLPILMFEYRCSLNNRGARVRTIGPCRTTMAPGPW